MKTEQEIKTKFTELEEKRKELFDTLQKAAAIMKDKQSIPGLLMVKSAFDQIQTPISFTFTLLGWILDEVDPKGVAAPDVVADIISEIETSKGIIEEALKQATTVEQN